MDIQTKDGITLRGIPDGTPDEAIKARIEKIRAEGGAQSAAAPAPQPAEPVTAAGVGAEVGKGALRGASDVGQLIQRGVTTMMGPAVGPVAQRGLEAVGAPSRALVQANPANKTEQFAGTASELLGAGAVGGGLSSIPKALSTSAMALGGATGEQVTGGPGGKLVGSLLPLGIPAAAAATGKVLGAGRNIIDPWLPGGNTRAAARTANAAAGSDRPAILQALRQADEITPGSRPTAGEAAAPIGRAEFSGLQRAVEGRAPTEYEAIRQSQNAARGQAIGRVAGTDADMSMAKGVRGLMTEQIYKEAGEAGIDKGMAAALKPQIQNLMERPAMGAAIAKAKEVFGNESVTLAKSGDVKGLQYVKQSLDDVIDKAGAPTSSIGTNQLRALETVRSDLIKLMEEISPKLRQADTAYRDWSKPINQMKVGKYLQDKLIPAMNDSGATANQRAASFAQAQRDAPRTLKGAGVDKYGDDLSEILTSPGQMQAVTGIGKDLARSSTHERLAQVGSEKAQDLLGQISPKVPAAGMFNPKYSVMRAIVNRIEGKAEGKSIDELARLMQDPKALAKAMEGMSPQLQSELMAALKAASVPNAGVIGAQIPQQPGGLLGR